MALSRSCGALCTLALLLTLGAPGEAAGQAPEPRAARVLETRIAQVLVEHGFENVAVEISEGTATVWFENRIYRYDMTALGVVAALAGRQVEIGPQDEASTVLELIPGNRGVSLVSVAAPAADWLRFLRGDGTAAWFRSRLALDTGRRLGGRPLSPRGLDRRQSPYWRTDLRLRPLFNFDLGIIGDPFDYSIWAAPEASVSPFPGGLLNLQANIELHSDFDPCGKPEDFPVGVPYEPCGPTVLPGRNTLSWGGWLPGNWLLAVSGGYFPGDRYGFAGEVGRLFLDGMLDVRAGGDASGNLQFLTKVTEYSNISQWTAFVAATHRPRGIDLETTLTLGRFREESLAGKLEVARRFHEFRVGFFGVKNEFQSIFGLNLRIPLPVRRYRNPSRLRPTTVPAFPFTYVESRADVGIQISLFDNLDRLRNRLYPPFILNNVEDLRRANRYVGREG